MAAAALPIVPTVGLVRRVAITVSIPAVVITALAVVGVTVLRLVTTITAAGALVALLLLNEQGGDRAISHI